MNNYGRRSLVQFAPTAGSFDYAQDDIWKNGNLSLSLLGQTAPSSDGASFFCARKKECPSKEILAMAGGGLVD